jgi:copper resistance protein C
MRIHVTIVTFLLAALGSAPAQAHALLDHASKLVGSTVRTAPRTAPREVMLSFTQNLEPAFSSVQVTDANGARVDQGKAQISGSTMRVGLKSLSPGTYKVHWHALSSTPTRRKEISAFR